MRTVPLDPDRPLTDTPLEGFRPNVAAVVTDPTGKVLVGRRTGANVTRRWQFPQGGIQAGETPRSACLRELAEETGLDPATVTCAGHAPAWLAYRFPAAARRQVSGQGQVQAWFLLHATDPAIDLAATLAQATDDEFDLLAWTTPAHALRDIVAFKRATYRQALGAFAAGPQADMELWRAVRADNS